MGEIILMVIVSGVIGYVGYCLGHGAAQLEVKDED